jgi:hypothetical protein
MRKLRNMLFMDWKEEIYVQKVSFSSSISLL